MSPTWNSNWSTTGGTINIGTTTTTGTTDWNSTTGSTWVFHITYDDDYGNCGGYVP